jgi:signal transduction histidine kinase
VRELCGKSDSVSSLPEETSKMPVDPIVWGQCGRFLSILRNLLTNAIIYGKPAEGEHRVTLSFDIVNCLTNLHPCLLGSERLDQGALLFTCLLTMYLQDHMQHFVQIMHIQHFVQIMHIQHFVQIMVTDNAPGLDLNDARLMQSLGLALPSASSFEPHIHFASQGNSQSYVSQHTGIGLKRIVSKHVAFHHGALGVHTCSEPDAGCSFVLALPLYNP